MSEKQGDGMDRTTIILLHPQYLLPLIVVVMSIVVVLMSIVSLNDERFGI